MDIYKKYFFLKKVLINIYFLDIILLLYGDVAQLARASGSYPEGREFDPHCRYQCILKELFKVPFFITVEPLFLQKNLINVHNLTSIISNVILIMW